MSRTAVLVVATIVIVTGGLAAFLGDLANDPRPRLTVFVETLIPVLGIAALVWWSWAAR